SDRRRCSAIRRSWLRAVPAAGTVAASAYRRTPAPRRHNRGLPRRIPTKKRIGEDLLPWFTPRLRGTNQALRYVVAVSRRMPGNELYVETLAGYSRVAPDARVLCFVMVQLAMV